MDNKIDLRNKYIKIRRSVNLIDKCHMDKSIAEKFFSFDKVKKSQEIYIYVSKQFEVDTISMIKSCLACDKKVAVPKCINSDGLMDFYYIKSFDDLELSQFNLMEPILERCIKVSSFRKESICVVPGLAFDYEGFRLGYGKGYYDRFLKNYKFTSIGLCYECCVARELPKESNDCKVNFVITEKNFLRC